MKLQSEQDITMTKLLLATKTARIGHFDYSISGNKYFNAENVFQLFGLPGTDEAFSPAKLALLVHDEDRELYLANILTMKDRYMARDAKPNQYRFLIGEVLYWVEIRFVFDDTREDIIFGIIQDITSLKQQQMELIAQQEQLREHEQQLLESQERLKMSHQMVNLADWSYDFQTELFGLSSEMCKIIGVDEKDSIFFTKEEILTTIAEQEDFFNSFDYATKNYLPYSEFAEITNKKTAEKISIQNVAYFQYDHEGKPIKAIATTQDVTHIKTSAIQLKESEDIFQALFEHSPSGIGLSRADTRIEFANNALCSLLGYSEEELYTMSFIDLTHPEDVEKDITLFNSVMQGRRDTYKIEKRYYTKSRNVIQVELTVVAVRDEKKSVKHIFGIMEDITRRKKEEEEKAIIAQCMTVILEESNIEINMQQILNLLLKKYNADRTYIFEFDWENNTNSKIFEALNTGIIPQKNNFQKIPNEYIERYIDIFASKEQVVVNDSSLFEESNLAIQELFLRGSATSMLLTPIFLSDKLFGYLGVDYIQEVHSWTERDKNLLLILAHPIALAFSRCFAKNELILAKEKAEESDRLKSEFIASMSHEIRTPLNAIVGFSGIMTDMLGDKYPDFIKYSNSITHNTNILLRLINDIIDYSQMESNSIVLNRTYCRPHDLIEAAIHSHQKNIPQGVEFLKNHELPNNFMIETDIQRVNQILGQLISNAIKFTKEGSITIGAEFCDTRRNIIMSISDTGLGISQDKFNIIFERFQKIDAFTQGTGLGLPIVKSLVQKLGGAIWLESEVGVGTTFFFTLPCIADEFAIPETNSIAPTLIAEEPQTQNENAEKNTEKNTIAKQKPVVLVAEDQDSNFDLLCVLLEDDYEIVRAQNGFDALDLFFQRKFDVILMDIKMPMMNGIDAITEIRKVNKEVPIIAQSAHAFDDEKAAAFEAGCNDYLVKPIIRRDLYATLAKLNL